ncbi:MAG: dihydrolipoamide acetyltransferase family protein, partial [Specibacter sp.]
LILRSDVEAAMAPVPTLVPVQTVTAAPVGTPAAGGAGVVDPRTGLHMLARTPLTGVKKAAAAALARSRREIPEATVWVDVDATALVDLRATLKAKDGTAPSLLAFVARFVTAGLARFPALNTQLVSEAGTETVVEFDGINLGFAAQTDRGLMVPVLRGAQGRSARALDGAIRELANTARDGRAGPALLSGGTFTINNYGVFGVDGSAAIINYPEAAMLGIGRITDKPWVVDGQLCVRKLTELTLAFDHRVCDGAVAAGFLRFIADAMENPAAALADL